MTDRSDLIQRANEFRQQAEREANEGLRQRLISMAEQYDHLAESQAWSEAHPADASALAEVFTRRS
jgi:two-component sensor histidine kinase